MARRDTFPRLSDPGHFADPDAPPQPRPRYPSGPGSAHDGRGAAAAGSGYTLMVAGSCPGKTSFLRLLLDTCEVAPRTTPEQAADAARFVLGAAAPTRHLRAASLEVQADARDGAARAPVSLTLIDTPSLDTADKASLDRSLAEIMRFLSSRFEESIEDEHKYRSGDHHVHLCIYLLNPDDIVLQTPHSDAHTPADSPLSLNHEDFVSSLPAVEVHIIRQLSSRVNVLPVIARADTVSTERLAALKHAVRRDLAEAGIGFGIFDVESDPPPDTPVQSLRAGTDASERSAASSKSSSVTALELSSMGSAASSATTPPLSPGARTLPRLPHAVFAPDAYAHGDGVPRDMPAPAELARRYSPGGAPRALAADVAAGRFTRAFRWGAADALDPSHCDFVHLRAAIFHHMQPLKTYTRDYLFEKFRVEVHHARQHLVRRPSPPMALPPQAAPPGAVPTQMPAPGPGPPGPVALPQVHHPPPHAQQLPPLSAMAAELDGAHPALAGLARHGPGPAHAHAHHAHALALGVYGPNGDARALPPLGLGAPRALSPVAYGTKKDMRKQKNKKITVACNFCRSRKLKCDGGRPACSQCIKRSHACDYMPHGKRRGGARARAEDASDGDGDSAEERAPESDPHAHPHPHAQLHAAHGGAGGDGDGEPHSRPASRRSSNVDMLIAETLHSPRSGGEREAGAGGVPPGAHAHAYAYGPPSPGPERTMADAAEAFAAAAKALPPFAAVAGAGAGAAAAAAAAAAAVGVPPVAIRPASEAQAAQRKRAAIVAGKGARHASNYGPKVVACNFCRARKTKCDGLHPSCSSCARRSLPCNYVNDPANGMAGGRRRNGMGNAASPNGTGNGVPPENGPGSPSGSRVPSPASGSPGAGGGPHGERRSPGSPGPFKRAFADELDEQALKRHRGDEDGGLEMDGRGGTPGAAVSSGGSMQEV